ncbi:MAG: Bro-N domain-containing protein [Bacteroidales bacterium]
MSNLSLFRHESFGTVRSQIVEDEPWFVAKDVCEILGISKYRDAIAKLEGYQRGLLVMDTPGGKQSLSTVNESGLYALIFKSRKAQAKEFQRWVTCDVLPSIRKTGQYRHVLDYCPGSNQRHGEIFKTLVYPWIVKVDNSRVRKKISALLEYYVDQIQD